MRGIISIEVKESNGKVQGKKIMKAQNIEIDINKLNTRELEQILAIVYNYESEEKHEQVLNRIRFVNGYMNERQEKEYVEKNCNK